MKAWTVKLILEGDFPLEDLTMHGQPAVDAICERAIESGLSQETLADGLAGFGVTCIQEAQRIRQVLVESAEPNEDKT